MSLKSLAFREKQKQSWDQLDLLLKQIEKKGIASLRPHEIVQLGKLYRTASSSLYVARNLSLDRNLHEYLESLVAKGYLAIYCTKPVVESPISRFLLHDFPSAVRQYKICHLLAALLLMVGMVVGYWTTALDAGYYFSFVDRQAAQGRTPYSSRETLEKTLTAGRETASSSRTLFASQLFTHNTKIGFLCFTLGAVLGLPTAYLLTYNGGMIGAMSQVFHANGLALSWYAWILPHGITELLAVSLCGGAGLMIAWAMIAPGMYGRRHRLKTIGRDAGIIVMGTVGLFLIAGMIEGYFRQTSLSPLPRLSLAFLTLVFWVYYLIAMPIPEQKNGNHF